MALFTVNRYLGTEDASLKPKPNKASLILERIKADAEKRRQERGLPQPKDTSNERTKSNDKEVLPKTTSKSTENTDKDVPESKPRTKKRRRKRDEEPTSVHSPDKQKKAKPNEQDTEKSSRRKRHKLQNAETEERNSPETVSMELGEVLPVDLSEEMKKRLADVSVKSSDYEEEVDENDVNVAPEKDGPHEIGGYTVLGDFKPKHIEKVKRVLPDWLASPNVVSADISHDQTPLSHVTGLHPVILEKLKQNGITTFFPVQAQVIPAMLSSLHHGYHVGPGGYQPSDICCSAPTGSGKTLAFALPIIQALLGRVVCQIRALVILPVQDLARQVYGVFHTYCHGTNIKVGLIIGQKSFQSEQQALVRKRLRGFQSQVDVVVATPGRLVDHINKTDGFDLRHLRFLVIDEADRMVSEVNQDWLTQVERAVHTPKCGHSLYAEFVRPQPGHITVAETAQLTMPVQKLLFSATLSQNPERLQQLRLFQPKLFTSVVKKQTMHKVGTTDGDHNHDHSSIGDTLESNRADFIGKYTTPVGLTEYFVESFTAEKPLVVLYFLYKLGYRQVLCFTNSVESTHRLYLLARLAGGFEVREFSSKLHATKRKRILEQFKSGKIDLLICSDAMARGMDVENVKYVVSYDSPLFIKTYIHRVGRTARAGKTGTALTLLERKEVFHFKKMLREAGKTDIRELKVGRADLEPLVPIYQEALQQLPDTIKNEKRKSSS